MCTVIIPGFGKCPQQWQYSIDFCNHFEVIMQQYAERAPRGTPRNTFCSATVWSQLPSDTRHALRQPSATEKLRLDTLNMGIGGWILMQRSSIKYRGAAYITARFKVYFVLVSLTLFFQVRGTTSAQIAHTQPGVWGVLSGSNYIDKFYFNDPRMQKLNEEVKRHAKCC